MDTPGHSSIRTIALVLAAVSAVGGLSAAMLLALHREPEQQVDYTSTSGSSGQGKDVLVLGDSVTVASREGLQDVLPGVAIDARVNRQLSDVAEKLKELDGRGRLRDVVVVALGINSPASPRVLDQALEAIGPRRTLVLVTPHGDRGWLDQLSEDYRQFAAAHPDRVVVADWDAASRRVTDFAQDGIHPGPQGGRIFAETVKDAIQQASAR